MRGSFCWESFLWSIINIIISCINIPANVPGPNIATCLPYDIDALNGEGVAPQSAAIGAFARVTSHAEGL
jgi:hypothetical protein